MEMEGDQSPPFQGLNWNFKLICSTYV